MKTLKLIVSLVLVLSAALALAGCGGDTPAKDYDVKQLAASIVNGCRFDDAYIEEVSPAEFTLNSIYGVDPALIAEQDGAKQAALYVASGSPEAVICLKAVDVDAANTAMDHIQNRILQDAESYKSYCPGEVPKLESAVKIVRGVYVIVAVTAENSAAQTLIEGLLK